MQLQYSLSKTDFLLLFLFTASTSEQIVKKRRKNKRSIFFLYMAIGITVFAFGAYALTIIFMLLSIAWLWFFPKYESKRFIKNYNNYLEANFKSRFEETVSLTVNPNTIVTKDNEIESEIAMDSIESVNEISSHIFIHLQSGESLILPKQKIENFTTIEKELKLIFQEKGIAYNKHSNWVWK